MVKPLISLLTETITDVSLGATQVSNVSLKIAEASQLIAQGSTTQAANLEESSAALHEISSMSDGNAKNAEEVNTLSNAAMSTAQDGNEAIEKMIFSMNEINESSKKIFNIIKVIDEIAFQTNLLALNAAVEAARAGEHGKGFAVVAEEVRNLSQRSAAAARDTTLLIEENVSKVENGSKTAVLADKALKNISENIKQTSLLIEKITVASKEQSEGIKQMNIAIAEVSEVTQKNTGIVNESSTDSQELSIQANKMNKTVERLAFVVLGESSSLNDLSDNYIGDNV